MSRIQVLQRAGLRQAQTLCYSMLIRLKQFLQRLCVLQVSSLRPSWQGLS